MTSFDEDGVMMRSSKEDRSWCVSCLVNASEEENDANAIHSVLYTLTDRKLTQEGKKPNSDRVGFDRTVLACLQNAEDDSKMETHQEVQQGACPFIHWCSYWNKMGNGCDQGKKQLLNQRFLIEVTKIGEFKYLNGLATQLNNFSC